MNKDPSSRGARACAKPGALPILLTILLCALLQATPTCAADPSEFAKTLREANALLAQGKLVDALNAVKAAGRLDTNRFEAPFLAAVIYLELKKTEPARLALNTALALAPASKKVQLESIAQELDALDKEQQPAPAPSREPAQLTGVARRQFDALMLILGEADQAKTDAERKKLLREFMTKSADFVRENPQQVNIWVVRAIAAMEVDYPGEGWLAGRRLKELGAEDSDDPKFRKVLAQLDRKGWLGRERVWRDWSKWTTDQVKQAANDGDAESQQVLGYWYSAGRSGLARDDFESAKWYLKAAESGDSSSQFELALCYGNGQGVQKDEAEAVKWYRKAAQGGDPLAQNNLGFSYEYGRGVLQDPTEAVKWYRKAAEQGNPKAQRNLARCCLFGQGMPKDEAEAANWYRKSADAGDLQSQNAAAWLLATSPYAGIRDGNQAVRYAIKACDSTQYTNSFYLGTLAASHAEAGSFEDAVKYAEMAINKADPDKQASFIKDTQERLKLYQAHQPYRKK